MLMTASWCHHFPMPRHQGRQACPQSGTYAEAAWEISYKARNMLCAVAFGLSMQEVSCLSSPLQHAMALLQSPKAGTQPRNLQ